MKNDIIKVLTKLLKEFESDRGHIYQSMCEASYKILEQNEREIFESFYEKSVKNRTKFFYRTGERVYKYDIPEYKIGNVYLFEPYDKYNRINWLSSKIKSIKKQHQYLIY